MTNTSSIQRADSTVNSVMGCNGCPLFPKAAADRKTLIEAIINYGIDSSEAKGGANDDRVVVPCAVPA